MIKIVDDPIVMKRLVNQHNIECYVEGKSSEYCNMGLTDCLGGYPLISCDRCLHRNHMTSYPESAFIGYTPQLYLEKKILSWI